MCFTSRTTCGQCGAGQIPSQLQFAAWDTAGSKIYKDDHSYRKFRTDECWIDAGWIDSLLFAEKLKRKDEYNRLMFKVKCNFSQQQLLVTGHCLVIVAPTELVRF